MLQIPTQILLILAAVVWLAAGFSVTYAGLTSATSAWSPGMGLAFALIAAAFLVLFLFISRQHVRRIKSYTSPTSSLFAFFDAKSYMILAVMVFLGASVRLSNLVPGNIIAPLYCAIGAALLTAAIYYVMSFVAVCRQLEV